MTSKYITPEGEQGMQLALFNANRRRPGWSDDAYAALCEFARTRQSAFTIDEMRKAIAIESPTDQRAWGGVVQRASRAGVIARVGFAPSASSHGSPMPLWQARNASGGQ